MARDMPFTFASSELLDAVGGNLQRNASALSTSLARLSIGRQFGAEADDATRLALSSKLNSDLSVYKKALGNVNDGATALNISQNALNQMGSIVDKLEELATIAAQDSTGDTRRATLDAEARRLQTEYGRIVDEASYNSNSLLQFNSPDIRVRAGLSTSSDIVLSTPLEGVEPQNAAYGAQFDGVNDHIAVTNGDSLRYTGGDMTIELWFKPTDSGNGYLLSTPFNASGDYNYQLAYNNGLTFVLGVDGVDASTELELNYTPAESMAGDWHHVAVTLSSDGGAKLFVDGELKDSGTQSWATPTDPLSGAPDITPYLSIGAGYPHGPGWGGDASSAYQGSIDEVRISDTVRYSASFTPDESPFVRDGNTQLLLHFEEGSGTSTADSSLGSIEHEADFYNGPTFASGKDWQPVAMQNISLLTADEAATALGAIADAAGHLSIGQAKLTGQLGNLETAMINLDSLQKTHENALSSIQGIDEASEFVSALKLTIVHDQTLALLAQANINPARAFNLLIDL